MKAAHLAAIAASPLKNSVNVSAMNFLVIGAFADFVRATTAPAEILSFPIEPPFMIFIIMDRTSFTRFRFSRISADKVRISSSVVIHSLISAGSCVVDMSESSAITLLRYADFRLKLSRALLRAVNRYHARSTGTTIHDSTLCRKGETTSQGSS
jgi:hypothetical protein